MAHNVVCGVGLTDLIPVKQRLYGVDKSSINIHGALIVCLHGLSTAGEEFAAAAIVYISPDVSGFYMSEDVRRMLIHQVTLRARIQ